MGDFIRFGYDITDDGDDFGGDNLDEVRAAAKWETVSRNATVFIIDVTDKSIFHSFQDPDAEDSKTSLIEIALTCVSNFIKSKIICSDRDLIACQLIGTAQSQSSDTDFKHVHTLLPLELPGAKSVIAVEKVKSNFDASKLGFGHEASFADAFWVTQNMFSRVTSTLSTKQVFLFTMNEDPHSSNQHARKATQQKILDLANNSIEVEVLGLAPPDGFFDMTVFWESALPQLRDKTASIADPTVKIKELLYRVTTKEYTSRALSSLKIDLFGKQFGVKVFSFVNIASKPAGVKLDKDTNKEVFSRTETVSSETGEVLMPDEVRFAQTFGGENIFLGKTERDSMKYLAPSGLTVMGFRSTKHLDFTNFLRPSHFIYPDESAVKGSLVLFQALLNSCLSQDVFAVCQIVTKQGSYPRLAALCPQKEIVQPDTGIQIKPPGFHVIYIPFAEDVRDVSLKVNEKRECANQEQVEAAQAVVNKLRFNFDPENFRNPQLSRFYAYIEAIALEKEAVEEPEDTINPSPQTIDSRLGQVGLEFVRCFGLQPGSGGGQGAKTTGAKRKADTSTAGSSNASKKASVNVNPIEMRQAAVEKKLGKYTVAVLKEACELYQLPTEGRKQNLIDNLQHFFKAN